MTSKLPINLENLLRQRQVEGERIESQSGSFLEACFALTLAIHQAPKREAFVCRDALLRFVRDRRSRQLAAGWQTKGADTQYKKGWNPDPIVRTLSAFANDFKNLGGGYVVIGKNHQGENCDPYLWQGTPNIEAHREARLVMRNNSGNAEPQLGSLLFKAKLGLGVPGGN